MIALSCLAARAPLDEFVLLNSTAWLITDDVVLIKLLNNSEDLVPQFATGWNEAL
jgi:hypothetical protein